MICCCFSSPIQRPLWEKVSKLKPFTKTGLFYNICQGNVNDSRLVQMHRPDMSNQIKLLVCAFGAEWTAEGWLLTTLKVAMALKRI